MVGSRNGSVRQLSVSRFRSVERTARTWVASPWARERARVRVQATQLAPKVLQAGGWTSKPLTFILSPSSKGEAALPRSQVIINEYYLAYLTETTST